MDKESHYLVSLKNGKLIELPDDSSIFVGRGEGSSIRVNDHRVSRQHAELYWDGSCFILHDLQSSNGTWHNDERIDTVELTDGDMLTIGSESFIYRRVNQGEKLALLRNSIRRKTAKHKTELVPELQISVSGGELRGSLESLPTTEVIQMLNATKRSGLLVVRGSSGKALLYFFKGEVTQAENFLEDGEVLVGDEAVLSTLRFGDGAFCFKPDNQGMNDNVVNKTQFLLFEAARLIDEKC